MKLFIDSLYNHRSRRYLKSSDWESGYIPDDLYEQMKYMSSKAQDYFEKYEIYYSVDRDNKDNKNETLIIHDSEKKVIYTDRSWAVNIKQPIGTILLGFLFYFRNILDLYDSMPPPNFEDIEEFAQLLSAMHCSIHSDQLKMNDKSKEALSYLIWNDLYLSCGGELHSGSEQPIDKIKRMNYYIDLCADKKLSFTENELVLLSYINNESLPHPVPLLVSDNRARPKNIIPSFENEKLQYEFLRDDIHVLKTKHYRIHSLLDLFSASLFELLQTSRSKTIKFKKCSICESIIVWDRKYCKWENPLIDMNSCDSISRSPYPVRKEQRLRAEKLFDQCSDKLAKKNKFIYNFDTQANKHVYDSTYNDFCEEASRRKEIIKNEPSFNKRTWLVMEFIHWMGNY